MLNRVNMAEITSKRKERRPGLSRISTESFLEASDESLDLVLRPNSRWCRDEPESVYAESRLSQDRGKIPRFEDGGRLCRLVFAWLFVQT